MIFSVNVPNRVIVGKLRCDIIFRLDQESVCVWVCVCSSKHERATYGIRVDFKNFIVPHMSSRLTIHRLGIILESLLPIPAMQRKNPTHL